MQVILLSCCKDKKLFCDKVENIYVSSNFSTSLEIAKSYADKIYVVSAKHSLLDLNDVIEPYEHTIASESYEYKRSWANDICLNLSNEFEANSKLIFLIGKEYSEQIRGNICLNKFNTYFPFKDSDDNYKKNWLNQARPNSTKSIHLDQFYSIVHELAENSNGYVPFGSFSVNSSFPQKGVYLFFEKNEYRLFHQNKLRVTRVGTHAVSKGSKSALWTRLRTHKGTSEGKGNHRSSIFRLHVGSALINKLALSSDSWGNGQSATKAIRSSEENIETMVSNYISQMFFLWLNVPGDSFANNDRAYIEKNIIALLAGPSGPIDVGSENWLGFNSANNAIPKSSLWNVNYVYDNYDPRFLDIFYKYAMATIGKADVPSHSLAPADWKVSSKTSQQKLF
ncbi:MAG: hypothetical protein PHO83_05270 [Geobacteraceae bacterium]|nr:hypothetical protein [Geobacteraceae bacterium]